MTLTPERIAEIAEAAADPALDHGVMLIRELPELCRLALRGWYVYDCKVSRSKKENPGRAVFDGLSARNSNALLGAGIMTRDQLLAIASAADGHNFRQIPGIGKLGRQQIKEWLGLPADEPAAVVHARKMLEPLGYKVAK